MTAAEVMDVFGCTVNRQMSVTDGHQSGTCAVAGETAPYTLQVVTFANNKARDAWATAALDAAPEGQILLGDRYLVFPWASPAAVAVPSAHMGDLGKTHWAKT